MLNYITFIKESKPILSSAELQKPNSKTGESRIEILNNAIIKGIELYNKNLAPFIILNTIENLDLILKIKSGEKFVTFDTSIGKIQSNNIIKSKLFGGAYTADKNDKSVSAAETTAIGESAQCYANALAGNLFNRKITLEDLTEENFESVNKFVFADRNPKQIFNIINDAWLQSSVLIANKLFADGYLKSINTYHRGSKTMSKIYNLAKSALKNSNKSLNNDKWNPGDIWIVGDVAFEQAPISSISAYNDFIKTHFHNKSLVGISLKLAKTSAKIELYNSGNIVPPYEIDRFLLRAISKSGTFQSAGKVSITLRNGLAFEGRAFQYMTNWAFEILGKNARAGKIGLSTIINITNASGVKIDKNIGKKIKSILNNKKLDIKFIKDWYKLYFSISTESKQLKEDEFVEFINSKFNSSNKNDLNWLWSKYIGTEIISKIKHSNNYNNIITDIINHAKSQTESSSIFIKVS